MDLLKVPIPTEHKSLQMLYIFTNDVFKDNNGGCSACPCDLLSEISSATLIYILECSSTPWNQPSKEINLIKLLI